MEKDKAEILEKIQKLRDIKEKFEYIQNYLPTKSKFEGYRDLLPYVTKFAKTIRGIIDYMNLRNVANATKKNINPFSSETSSFSSVYNNTYMRYVFIFYIINAFDNFQKLIYNNNDDTIYNTINNYSITIPKCLLSLDLDLIQYNNFYYDFNSLSKESKESNANYKLYIACLESKSESESESEFKERRKRVCGVLGKIPLYEEYVFIEYHKKQNGEENTLINCLVDFCVQKLEIGSQCKDQNIIRETILSLIKITLGTFETKEPKEVGEKIVEKNVKKVMDETIGLGLMVFIIGAIVNGTLGALTFA
jgi:hypothetical protein